MKTLYWLFLFVYASYETIGTESKIRPSISQHESFSPERRTAFAFRTTSSRSILMRLNKAPICSQRGQRKLNFGDRSCAAWLPLSRKSSFGLFSTRTADSAESYENSTNHNNFYPLQMLKSLEKNLTASVRDERYEDASIFRDRIRQLRMQDEITRLNLILEDSIAGLTLRSLLITFLIPHNRSAETDINFSSYCYQLLVMLHFQQLGNI
jgi:hypothetical protein